MTAENRQKPDRFSACFFVILCEKGVDPMQNPYYRLLAAGIRPDCAAETVREYQRRSDPEGLEKYITEIECRTEASDR